MGHLWEEGCTKSQRTVTVRLLFSLMKRETRSLPCVASGEVTSTCDTLPGPVLPAGGVLRRVWLKLVAASGLASQHCSKDLLPPRSLCLCWFSVITVCHFLNLSAPAFLCPSYRFCLRSFISFASGSAPIPLKCSFPPFPGI